MSKGYQRRANSKEVKKFLQKSISSNDFEKISVSKIKDDAKSQIKSLTGIELKRIVLDTCSVKHALRRADHHIDIDDFKKVSQIINKTKLVSLEKNHCGKKPPVKLPGDIPRIIEL